MKKLLPAAVTTAAALAWSTPAWALDCDEIMNMVDVNVPTTIIVQTIDASGEVFDADTIRCLTTKGAPTEVIDAAKATLQNAAPEEEETKAPPRDEVREGSQFEQEEGIGDRQTGRALEDRGGDEEEDPSADPQKLEDAIKAFEAKKPLSASYALFEMLQDNQFPEKEDKILYYLGRSLYDLQMYHSAQYYFIEVLKKGPNRPYFKYALPKLVSIAKFTGDDSELARIVTKIPPEEFPRSARNQFYYLLGIRLYEEGKLTEARKYFGQVSDKSDLYTKSKYFEGVIYSKQDKLRSAVRSFTDVVKTRGEAQTAQELAELDRLRDLSLLNIARIYYAIDNFEDANKYYGTVPRDSMYWPQALFESSWANFVLSDLNLTLGQILTVESPFYSEDEFLPEATILKALTFFNFCEYGDVERVLTEFDATYKPMHEEMRDFLKQYSSEEGKRLADQAFDRYFGDKPQKTALSKAVFARFLRNTELSGIVNHLQVMEQEEALIDAQKSQWKDSIGNQLHKVIAEDRERLKRRAGLALLREMAQTTSYLGELLTQSQIIRFEVVDAKRADYQYKLSNIDVLDTAREVERDFAVSRDKIYWPFNGEFWQDELGYYRYTEQGSCK